MSDDADFAVGIVLGACLLIAASLAFVLWLNPAPRAHIYYCCEDNGDWRCAPCRDIPSLPVSVSDQFH